MADFCKQCSIDLFGEDCGDMKLGPLEPEHFWPVLCEGCGPTMVNEEGECVYANCDLKHGIQEPVNEIQEDNSGNKKELNYEEKFNEEIFND
mgnify:CR=1 FL=1